MIGQLMEPSIIKASNRLNEMWAYFNCLMEHKWFKSDNIASWYANELIRFQQALGDYPPDGIALINGFYEGMDMYALRNAYKDIADSACIRKYINTEPEVPIPGESIFDSLNLGSMSTATKIAIAAAIGLGAAYLLMVRK